MISFNFDNNSPCIKEMHYLGPFVTMARETIHTNSSQEGKILLGLRLSQRAQEQANSWASRAHW